MKRAFFAFFALFAAAFILMMGGGVLGTFPRMKPLCFWGMLLDRKQFYGIEDTVTERI